MLVGGFLFRVEIVNAWPPAAKLYATIGLPVNPAEVGPGAGLNLRVVSTAQEQENGTAVLIIEGEVANDTSQVMDVPEMRASLTAEDDRVLREWQFAAESGRLLPGESSIFKTRVADPPGDAVNLSIEFIDADG